MNKITVTVAGRCGSGKTTIATLLQRYLNTMGFTTHISLTDNAMPPCPTELRKKMTALLDSKTEIQVLEQNTASEVITK